MTHRPISEEELEAKAAQLFPPDNIIVMSEKEMGTLRMLKEKWQREALEVQAVIPQSPQPPEPVGEELREKIRDIVVLDRNKTAAGRTESIDELLALLQAAIQEARIDEHRELRKRWDTIFPLSATRMSVEQAERFAELEGEK